MDNDNNGLGPYDEVIWIPGYFEVPQTGRRQVRISRIYVSSIESVFNGEWKQWLLTPLDQMLTIS